MKRFIALLLAFISCFTVALTACDCGNEEEATEGNGRVRYQGTHIFNIEESETDYLVQNGATQYRILIPEETSKYEGIGASELQTLFREATGIQLVVEKETDSGYSHDANQKFISIGKTKLFESSGLVADKNVLKNEGYRMVTKDKNIYLFSAYDVGNVYAVYELMEILFDFEYYYYDCYELDKGVTDKKLAILDVTDVPDFSVRGNATRSIRQSDDINAVHRMRSSDESYLLALGDYENGYDGVGFHNTSEILPITKKDSKEPVPTDEAKWHADGNNQLCYTAHGDPESYERMYKRAAEVVEMALKAYPAKQYPTKIMASISCEDEFTFCDCDACTAEELKYGAKSASIIKFLNNVMVEVRAWMELPENADYKRDEFYLIFFAYFAYLGAPAHYDESLGCYVVNSDLEIRDDVGVMYAISDVTSTVSMYDEANKDTKANSEAWFDIATVPYIWTYSGNTEYGPAMWPSYEHLDEDGYNFYACGADLYFHDYIDYADQNNTGFQSLKLYIDSKMMWDCSQSIADLKDKWFNAMFGEAKDIMRELFEKELIYVSNVYDQKQARKSHGWGIIYDANDWNLEELKSWLELTRQAQEKVDTIYKNSNPEKHAMITHHINQEYYFPALSLVMSQTKESAGQIYVDTVKYLQANIDEFKGYSLGDISETTTIWKNIKV